MRPRLQAQAQTEIAVTPVANPEQLIRAAHAVVGSAGVAVGTQRVTRTVRKYVELSEPRPDFVDFLADALRLTERRRRQVAADPEVRSLLGHRDPTGETAVANVMRGRGW